MVFDQMPIKERALMFKPDRAPAKQRKRGQFLNFIYILRPLRNSNEATSIFDVEIDAHVLSRIELMME